MTDPTNPAPPAEELRAHAMALRENLTAFSADVEDARVLRVHFDRNTTRYDRASIIALLNGVPALTDHLSVLTVENERMREVAKCVASDMEHATAGGMSWISDGECQDFVRRLRRASSLPAMKGEG